MSYSGFSCLFSLSGLFGLFSFSGFSRLSGLFGLLGLIEKAYQDNSGKRIRISGYNEGRGSFRWNRLTAFIRPFQKALWHAAEELLTVFNPTPRAYSDLPQVP
jgi:hypothetical protein